MKGDRLRARTGKYVAAIAAIAAVVGSAGSAWADPHLTDHDAFPKDVPPTYDQVVRKVLDFSSDPSLLDPWIQTEFFDKTIERQLNSLRAVRREFMDLQTLSSPTIRTHDLTSPYHTTLSCFASYYRVSDLEIPQAKHPHCLTVVEVQPTTPVTISPPVVEPAPVAPMVPAPPQRPVPALW
ncbi:MAG: hypothetical protein HC918_09000 [Oscillatoriales cyanobacterium SM2_1_8]|nr:hypothetical protein [Oscillatoriales cyanobacterium SM2_1_8]